MSSRIVFAFFLVGLVSLSGVHAAVDCARGCPTTFKPVCSADGSVQYINRCIAECQGVSVTDGPCKATNALRSIFTGTSSAAAAWVQRAVLDRYASSGYKLVGFLPRVAKKPTAAGKVLMELRSAQPASEQLVRLSLADGALYLGAASSSQQEQPRVTLQEQAAPLPGRRHLRGVAAVPKVIAAAAATKQQQLNAVGQLTAGAAWSCTATLIAPGVILTAAHCVFDRGDVSGRPVVPQQLAFAPGRQLSAAGAKVDPFGSSEVESCTFSRDYLPDASDVTTMWQHDVAVCQLKDKTLGSKAGVMGVQVTEAAWAAPLKHAGYPAAAGKPAGSLRVSGCDVAVKGAASGVIAHNCGSALGESGAPLFDAATGNVRAVAVYQVQGQYNAATLITPSVWSRLIAPSISQV